MVQDVRSLQSGGKSFDFSSERGVRDLLKAIRESDLPSVVRNELRDLVFMYSSGGGDAAVRNILEEQIRSYNIIPLPSSEIGSASASSSVTANRVSGFSAGRAAPVFRPAVLSVTKKIEVPPAAIPEVVRTVPVVSSTPTVAPVEPTVITPPAVPADSISVRIIPTIPSTPVPVLEVMAPTATTAVAIPEPIVSTPVVEVIPVVPKPPLEIKADRVPVEVFNSAEYIDRIREIKTEVNNRVGNPVNLISIDKALGNEYMQALLSAMKQLNGGDTALVVEAMAKLEGVYAQVMVVIDRAATTSAVPTKRPTTVAPPKVMPPTPVPTAPLPPPPSYTVPLIPPPVFDASPESAFPDADTTPESVVPVRPISLADDTSALRPKIEIRPPVTPEVAATIPVVVDTETVPITSTRFNINTPVAALTPLRSIDELPTAASLKNIPGSDPLLTKEVDDGLQQLLAEWGLFKKSGLFGTGPNGREHPLFKKVAPLQIPLLLSGRFEGSTQEIKQSITDYMNGWRYEQGIVYEEGETFETYLRRVIRHIIDWQSKKLGT